MILLRSVSQTMPGALALGLSTLLVGFLPQASAHACLTSKPPDPACGKTLVLAKSVPGVVLNAGETSFNVPSLVFFNMLEFPPGSGICPAGPHSLNISMTATCTSAPHGSGSVHTTITTGFNQVSVPISVGAGPQRRCDITGTATLTLGDGMVLTATGDQVVCLVDPAPGNPLVPRLDLQLLSGSEIVRVHAGDQSTHPVRITNNDPTETFTGTLDYRLVNSARLPGASGPMPTGTGVYSVSDPVEGDNFPIAFAEDLVDGCVELPDDPTDPTIPTLIQSLRLGPGESMDLDVYARPWGMCGDGSCGEGKLVLEGSFSDLSPGLACAGLVVAVDNAQPPSYGWPDAGRVARASPGDRPRTLTLTGEPRAGDARPIHFEMNGFELFVDQILRSGSHLVFADAYEDSSGRIYLSFPDDYDPASRFDLELTYVVSADPLEAKVATLHKIAGAPTGFEDVAPAAVGVVELRPPGDPVVDSVQEITYQVHAVGIDELGERREIRFQNLIVVPTETGFEVRLVGGAVESGTGVVLQAVELVQDFRGYSSVQPQGDPSELFSDGFESGNIVRWSSSS